MATQVYKTLSKIFGIILLVVGIAALSGGLYADSFIKAQLEEQDVVLTRRSPSTASSRPAASPRKTPTRFTRSRARPW